MYKVILIDDEPLIVKSLMCRVDWERLNFQVSGAFSDPDEVLVYFETESADLALMDIRMPNRSGIELMEQIRKRSNCRFLVISGYSDFHYAQAAIQLGAADYLLKPVANHVLTNAVAAVKRALDHAAEDRSIRLQRALFSGGAQGSFDRQLLRSFDIYRLPGAFLCCACRDASYTFRAPSARTVPLFVRNGTHFFLICCYGGLPSVPADSDRAVFSGVLSSPEELLPAIESLYFAAYASFLTYLPAREADPGALKSLMNSLRQFTDTQKYDSCLSLIGSISRVFRQNRYPMSYFETLFNIVCSSLGDHPLLTHSSADEIAAIHPTIDEAQSALEALFSQSRHMDQTGRPCSSQQIIQSIIEEMRERYQENLTLKFFADKYYLNMTYLSMLFKSVTRENFVSLLTRIRMENSANFLASTDLLIEQISRACGYNDVSYFNRAFKKYYHMTPTAYRLKHRTGKEDI